MEKREEHLALVGTIRPIEDPWWDTHTPPLTWNCKCRIRPTDKPVAPIPKETAKDKPAPGPADNPGRSGSVFDLKSHPYTRRQGDPHCLECRRQGLVKSSDLLDLPGDRLCPMHAAAMKIVRRVDKFVSFDEMKSRLLKIRKPENYETTLKLREPLMLEGHKYSKTRVVDRQLLHATRDTKRFAGKTLSLEELMARFETDLTSFDEWRIDERNSSIILAVKYSADKRCALKYVFRLAVDQKDSSYLLDFVTTEIVDRRNILQYEKIK